MDNLLTNDQYSNFFSSSVTGQPKRTTINLTLYLPRVQAGGLSNRTEAALHPQAILNGKETIMRKRIILFVLPVIAFLIMATALVLTPAFATHAAGTSHSKSAPISAPAKPSGGMHPDAYWSW